MKNEILKQIITQIRKYELIEEFEDKEEFQNWVSKLNSTQINNFLSLDIPLEEVKNINHLLINENLLNCQDYKQKIKALSTLKNADGWWHLFKCTPNFLNSKNFYKDIDMLSKADTAKHGLQILDEDAFINSPYHEEDLKLLVESHDTKEEEPLDYIVSEAIASVASNIDSIKSPYHQEDMKLIATSGSDCLQSIHSYPEDSLNILAINKVSLSDKYHLENMKILATNPIASRFLYEIMTDPYLIKGKNYRQEIEALVNAKSKITARALYYYIVNPDEKFGSEHDYYHDCGYDLHAAYISDKDCIAGRNDKDYLKNLVKINEIDDRFVIHYVALLMNPKFINSPYKNFDLELLKNVSDKFIFMDLYRLMTNEESLDSIHHKKDAVMISQISAQNRRKMLLKLATNKYSLNSDNHDYDMEYIRKLDLGSFSKQIYKEIKYYLFIKKGIDDPKHKENLETLSQGIFVERTKDITNYLDDLENELNKNNESPIFETSQPPMTVSKTKSLIKRIKKKLKF